LSNALASSRAFLRRFYDVLASVKSRNPIFSIKITCEIRENIKVWLDFLQKCNGVDFKRISFSCGICITISIVSTSRPRKTKFVTEPFDFSSEKCIH
jgi:hypothetical protein